jgi:hypothetical protein
MLNNTYCILYYYDPFWFTSEHKQIFPIYNKRAQGLAVAKPYQLLET